MVSLPTTEIKLQNTQQQWNGVNAMVFLTLLDFHYKSEFALLDVHAAQEKMEKCLKNTYYLKYKFTCLARECNFFPIFKLSF